MTFIYQTWLYIRDYLSSITNCQEYELECDICGEGLKKKYIFHINKRLCSKNCLEIAMRENNRSKHSELIYMKNIHDNNNDTNGRVESNQIAALD